MERSHRAVAPTAGIRPSTCEGEWQYIGGIGRVRSVSRVGITWETMSEDSHPLARRAAYLLLSPVMLWGDCIATGVVVFWWLFLRGPEAAFEETIRFVDRWFRFARTGGGEWEWDLIFGSKSRADQ